MTAFYNEIEPYAAQWIRNLSDAGHVARGVVDERSIADLEPSDLAGYRQAHFFAGIGVWSHALRLAGVADGAAVWTGSCPCQPFSPAGKQEGFSDPRHLWPKWFPLIRECRPPVVFGEQVEGPDGRAWLDLVSADLEGIGYAFGAAILPAAGVGAPHARHRIFFVAVADCERLHGLDALLRPEAGGRVAGALPQTAGRGVAGELADLPRIGRGEEHADGGGESARGGTEGRAAGLVHGGAVGELGNADDARLEGHGRPVGLDGAEGRDAEERHRPTSGFWGNAEWVYCRDGKWRPVEPGTFPLAHGAPARVGRLRASGNAISPQVAATFIQACRESGVAL